MKIIRLNLERHHTRKDFGNGALVAMRFRFEDIIIWKGKDNLPYQKTYQLYEDAVQDGFPHFQHLLDTHADNKMPITFASQHWNWCRILRHIANDHDEPVVVLLDTFFLNVGPKTIVNILNDAQTAAATDKVLLKFVALNYDKTAIKNLEFVPPDNRFIRGTPSYAVDACSIISPIGAEFLLEKWAECTTLRKSFPGTLEHAMFKNFPLLNVDFSGIYTVADPIYVRPIPRILIPSSMHILKNRRRTSEESVRSVEETRR